MKRNTARNATAAKKTEYEAPQAPSHDWAQFLWLPLLLLAAGTGAHYGGGQLAMAGAVAVGGVAVFTAFVTAGAQHPLKCLICDSPLEHNPLDGQSLQRQIGRGWVSAVVDGCDELALRSRAEGAHFRWIECPCTSCTAGDLRHCIQGVSARVLPGRHPILEIGVAARRAPQMLAFLVTREVTRTKGFPQAAAMITPMSMALWMPLGFLVPLHLLPLIAPLTWAALATCRMAESMACDISAARYEPDAMLVLDRIQLAQRSEPWRTRISTAVLCTRPPLTLRRAAVRFVTQRNEPTGAPWRKTPKGTEAAGSTR